MRQVRVLICGYGCTESSEMTAGLEADGLAVLPCDDPLSPGWPAPDITMNDLSLSPLPQLNLEGIGLAERLAKAQIPFVLVAERRDDELIQLAAQCGAIGYFLKPIQRALLGPSIHVGWHAPPRPAAAAKSATGCAAP